MSFARVAVVASGAVAALVIGLTLGEQLRLAPDEMKAVLKAPRLVVAP